MWDPPGQGIEFVSPASAGEPLTARSQGKSPMCLVLLLFLLCCSVAQSCPTLCDPMDCSTPGFPILRHLLELAQTHVHCTCVHVCSPKFMPKFKKNESREASWEALAVLQGRGDDGSHVRSGSKSGEIVQMNLFFKILLWYIAFLTRKNGEGNGTPLQYSCLKNPMDRGAW